MYRCYTTNGNIQKYQWKLQIYLCVHESTKSITRSIIHIHQNKCIGNKFIKWFYELLPFLWNKGIISRKIHMCIVIHQMIPTTVVGIRIPCWDMYLRSKNTQTHTHKQYYHTFEGCQVINVKANIMCVAFLRKHISFPVYFPIRVTFCSN